MLAEQEPERPRTHDDTSSPSKPRGRFHAACELARRIESLLGDESVTEPYEVQLARALAAQLADELAKMARNE